MTEPISIVFSMHKCGSSTLMQALREVEHNPERGYAENMDYIKPVKNYDYIITGIRDPIARNISYFFEMNGEYFSEQHLSLSEIKDFFLNKFDQEYPLEWFDRIYSPYTNVYPQFMDFPAYRGWRTYYGQGLIIQLEAINDSLGDAFEDLIGKRVGKIYRAKTTKTRPYADLYKEFTDWISFDYDYVSYMLDNDFVNHFYTKAQRAEMEEKWLD